MITAPASTDCHQQPAAPEPPDGGWGWVVLAGCVYNMVVFLSIPVGFSIEFGDLLTDMELSATTISWIFNIQGLVWNMSACLVGPLCQLLGWRRVACTSGAVAGISYSLLIYASSPAYMFFLFSFILGASAGLAMYVNMQVLPSYFEKNLGLALCLNSTSVAVSQMITPPIITALQTEFGNKGATLLHGGIILNSCVAAAMFRPLESRRNTTTRATNDDYTFKNEKVAYASIQSLQQIDIPLDIETANFKQSNRSRVIILQIVIHFRKCIKSLKSTKVILIGVGLASFITGYSNLAMIFPFVMREEGYTNQEAAWCLACAGFGSIIARLVMSFTSDRKWFKKRVVYIFGSLLATAFSFALNLVLFDLRWIIGTMVCWSASVGSCLALYLVILMEAVGKDEFGSAIGAIGLILSVGAVTIAPLPGVIRDATASYTATLCMCSVLHLCMPVLMLILLCLDRSTVSI